MSIGRPFCQVTNGKPFFFLGFTDLDLDGSPQESPKCPKGHGQMLPVPPQPAAAGLGVYSGSLEACDQVNKLEHYQMEFTVGMMV